MNCISLKYVISFLVISTAHEPCALWAYIRRIQRYGIVEYELHIPVISPVSLSLKENEGHR